ncbi:MAG: hypothetical protein WC047_07480 [Kiritimatiellales bacterium]
MKKQIFTLCAMLFALCSPAWAQWIIDGQQVQTLNLNVSDPQALYTDGSREMTAPLAFAPSLTATSGMIRATLPWTEDNEFFIIDEGEEVLKLTDSGSIGFQIGAMIINQAGIAQTAEGTGVDFGEHMLSGGWQIDQVLPYPEAVISRGFADGKYMIAGETATQPLKFAQSITATNGALQIYSSDNADHLGYFKTLSFQDGLQFCTEGSASLLFGSGNDGLLVGPANLVQLEYGKRIDFETGELTGSTGAKQWHVATDPTDASGIVNRGYADSRYLRSDSDLTAPLSFSSTSTATSGLFRAYYAPEGRTEEFFIINGADEYVQLSSGCGTLRVGDTFVHGGGLYSGLNSAAISFDEKLLSGGWMVEDIPNHSGAVMSRGYADARYLRQGVDLTAPLAFAASYTATGGMFRAYVPWDDQNSDLFVFDGEEECIDLSADQNAALRIGGVMINQSGISGFGVSVGFEDNTLFGPWKLNQVVDNSLALLNRSYADSRYVMNGQDAVEFGVDTVAGGDYAAAFGYKNLASGKYSVAFNGGVDPDEPEEGVYTNVASGIGAAVFGWGNVASGNGAVAFGWESVASGNWSLAAGSSDAIGEFSTALGEVCDATGSDSLAAGYNTSATGSKSVAFGHSTTASAQGSFANGFASSASGNYSTAWGSYCEASGLNSIALGTRAKALHPGSVVIADSQNADVTSATNDTFTVRAQNGVYLQTDAIHSSGPLVFGQSVTSHLFQAYVPWAGQSEEFFKADIDNECFKFSTGNAKLRIGSDLLYDGSGIEGFGQTVSIEEGILYGDWALDSVLNADEAIITRIFADNRYLRRDVNLTAPLPFDSTLTATSGLFRVYIPWAGEVKDVFILDANNERLNILGSGDIGIGLGGMTVKESGLYYSGGATVSLEEQRIYGAEWTLDQVAPGSDAIINRGYADSRYPLRSEGITTNRVIQAGDTLVISNGIITAINP